MMLFWIANRFIWKLKLISPYIKTGWIHPFIYMKTSRWLNPFKIDFFKIPSVTDLYSTFKIDTMIIQFNYYYFTYKIYSFFFTTFVDWFIWNTFKCPQNMCFRGLLSWIGQSDHLSERHILDTILGSFDNSWKRAYAV